ncbi:MAG: signal peptidase I [Lachnospiraceae bacterium]|nr:signal peptidase I [Lachnospiraceae bacterium]
MKKKIYLVDNRPKFLSVLETIVQVTVIAALGLFAARFMFHSTATSSRSMEPTIVPESVVFTDRCIYRLTEPKRFDVITFRRETGSSTGETDIPARTVGNGEQDILIRRVVGLPGETIRIEKGTVFINEVPLDVSAYISEITSDGIAKDSIRLSENEYFVLGDTPANSEDSRSYTVGVVLKRQILGRAWLAAKSITEIHMIDQIYWSRE